MGGNKIIFGTGKVAKQTVRCFLEKYLAQVKSQVKGERLSKSRIKENTSTRIKEKFTFSVVAEELVTSTKIGSC